MIGAPGRSAANPPPGRTVVAGLWERIPLGAVVLAGLTLRVLYAALARPAPLVLDMGEYHEYGVFLALDGAYGSAYRLPGYPLFVAFFYALFGVNIRAVLLGQALLGTAVVWLTGRAGRSLLGEGEAKLAAAFVAFNPTLIVYTNFYLSENLFAFLLIAFVAVLARYAEQPRAGTAALLGLCVGAAMLTRMVGLGLFSVAVAVIAVVALRRGRAEGEGQTRSSGSALVRGLLHTVIALMLIAACLGPWMVRNHRWYGEWVIDTTGGRSLLIGHNPGSTGKLDFSSAVAFDKNYRHLPEVEAQRAARQEAIAHMKAKPGRTALLGVRKAMIFLSPEFREYILAYSNKFFGRLDDFGLSMLLLFGLGSFAALVAFAWLALFRPIAPTGEGGGPPWRLILFGTIAYFVAVHMATFAEGRFHLPQIPLFALLAAVGIRSARTTLRSLRGRTPAMILFTAGGLFLLAAWAIELRHHLPFLVAIYGKGGHQLYLPFGAF